ncbi:hypothetical protein [Lacticaseibacillus zhaodongensis]|uniref:hypothetical protein n=1 Tax=Lacticaseibacillus zhaodongensis TaxID=2668065 RepID=UPI0012D2AEC4|nr:hypothetical protein [Lacticaseibacillus zhaodongensis]
MNIVLSIICFALAIWQLSVSYHYFRVLQTKGSAGTSAFSLLGLWQGIVVAVIFVIIGATAISGFFNPLFK